jgi:hypothetical protein
MNEFSFFYFGLAAFSLAAIGLALTIIEFRNLGKSEKIEIASGEPVILKSKVGSTYEDNSTLKAVKTGKV